MFSLLLNRRQSEEVASARRFPNFERGMRIAYHGRPLKSVFDVMRDIVLFKPHPRLDEEIIRAVLEEPYDPRLAREAMLNPCVFAGRNTLVNQTTVALTAATAKTSVGILAATNVAVVVSEIGMSFDGATSTNVPVLLEICANTFATNPPGTSSTSVTPTKADNGYPETIQFTAARNWTVEPTVITVAESKYVGQFNGVYHIIKPSMKPWIARGAQGWSVRLTSPNNVNSAGHMACEE